MTMGAYNPLSNFFDNEVEGLENHYRCPFFDMDSIKISNPLYVTDVVYQQIDADILQIY